MKLPEDHHEIKDKLLELYRDLFLHNGYGELSLEMRFLKKGQKEIIIHCGKDYRYVVDYPSAPVKVAMPPETCSPSKKGHGSPRNERR